jgi:hypothetical protein
MAENDMYICELCNYSTNRKYNLDRHNKFKHSNLNNQLIQSEIINNDNNDNDNNNDRKLYICCKCNKKYKIEKYLIEHQKKCKGLSSFHCPNCMKLFSHSSNKSEHIKNVNCKPNSIFTIIDKNEKLINNFGLERIDYIKFDDIIKIFVENYEYIVPKYIELKYFNSKFPENHNIKYTKSNDCLIKENDEWIGTNLTNLANKLLHINSHELYKYYLTHKNKIDEIIKDDYILLFVSKINYSELSINKKLLKQIINKIKDYIRTLRL